MLHQAQILISESTLPQLRELASTARLFAILDACDTPAVPEKTRQLGQERAISLYRGEAEEDYWAIAPYLVKADEDLLNWIETVLWKQRWGIFLVADSTIERLRTHLRHFLKVHDHLGDEVYFRFYDPHVLYKFLPTCNAQQVQQLYGPVEAYLVGSAEQGVSAMTPRSTARTIQPTVFPIGQRFVIREEQMVAFGPEAEIAFEGRLIRHLREHHAHAVEELPDDVLLRLARTGVARARRYGMTWESNLTAYVALMFDIAPNFDQHPRMQMILSSRQILPDKKLDELIARTTEQTWQEVKRNHDPRAWLEPGKETV